MTIGLGTFLRQPGDLIRVKLAITASMIPGATGKYLRALENMRSELEEKLRKASA